MNKRFWWSICFLSCGLTLFAEDGSRLWLRQTPVNQASVCCMVTSPTLTVAREELASLWRGGEVDLQLCADEAHRRLGKEGYMIHASRGKTVLEATTEQGLLYATYHLLRLQAEGADCTNLDIKEKPAFDVRILNHWDNLDGTIERGYAGRSLWKWEELSDSVSARYREYARANASVGINGTVLNNVNASPEILSKEYLEKVRKLADIFRPYGIKVYLSVNFVSPIPDFGGFLVKANSEGQPGPCDYGRTHAEGANMLAEALKPYGGIVMWRAFVYSPSDADRAKQAYLEFQPLDGRFGDNVIIQVKNGPIDFQPREPYSPLFGAMPHTSLMVEFQITQEYLGHSNHLAYLATMWKEFYRYVQPSFLKGVAGVVNVGDNVNWCGHDFAQANWYAYGRLAWNPALSAEEIAREWLAQTFTTDRRFVEPMTQVMMDSREAVVDYMMPLGLHHIFAWGHHYGPEPWCEVPGARADWLPSYYHQADKEGLGFDRSRSGSNAVSQYPDSLARVFDSLEQCPEEYLLWFHHVDWNYTLRSGRSLWDELCYKYQEGVDKVREFQKVWKDMQPYVDGERYQAVAERLDIQVHDAVWWKDACLGYFRTFSKKKYPKGVERPVFTLQELKKVKLTISNYEPPMPDMLPRKK